LEEAAVIYSPPDIALILGIALLVFGPKRLPELGHAIGQGIGNFKKSMAEAESTAKNAVNTASSVPVANSTEPAANGESLPVGPSSVQ
jgi:sec-independent protein translocase protein TatA